MSNKRKNRQKRTGNKKVRITKTEVSAIWRATSAGDMEAAVFIVRDLLPELSLIEARRVAVRISKGANSPGVTIGSDPTTGEYADVSLAP